MNKKTAELFSRDALCFYRPLPRKKLGVPDLLLYMKQCISNNDLLLIVIASLAVVLVGMIEPRVYSLLTGTVLKMKQIHLLIGVGSFLRASAFASIVLNLIKSLLIERINTKTSQAVEASVMIRLLSLPVSFFRKYSSGELSSRVGSVNTLCSMIIQNVLSLGLGGLMSLLYITRIVIAHRLSTIRNCNRILMLHDGEIIEEGTYDELIRLNGEFADMVARQQV